MITRMIFAVFITTTVLISCGLDLPRPHDVKFDEKEFNDLANFILTQQQIHEMDDFTRHFKSINGVSVKLTANEGDQDAQFLNIVTDSLELDSKIVSELKVQLERTKLREFTKSGDSILFITDGFLDDSWGFIYSNRGTKMDSTWFTFKGHSVKFVESINKNWKRVAIH